MSLRARAFEPRSSPLRDRRGDRIGVFRARSLPDDLHGVARLAALAAPALRQAARGLGDAPVPIVLAVGEASRPDAGLASEELLDAIARRALVTRDRKASLVVRGGNAGFSLALRAGLERLGDGDRSVVVGAVDSFYDPELLAWLDEDGRLNTLERDGGIVPSEGAAFVVLRRRAAGYPSLLHVGVADVRGEPEDPRAAVALAREAVERAGSPPLRWIMTDVNGERHRRREWAVVQQRLGDALQPAREHIEPVAALGDTGAATGALLVSTALQYWMAGCAPSDRCLVLLHADGPERGAILIEQGEVGAAICEGVFRASVGAPSLHRLARAWSAPSLPTAPPRADLPLPVISIDEVVAGALATITVHEHSQENSADVALETAGAAEPPTDAEVHATPESVSGVADIREEIQMLMRGVIEEIAALGRLRPAEGEQPWASAEPFERRLLANLDALAALDNGAEGVRVSALDEVIAYAKDGVRADSGRAFLRSFSLGCNASVESLREAVEAVRAAPPATLEAHRDALSLCAHPEVGDVVRALLGSDDPRHVELALHVMRLRRKASHGEVVRFLEHPDVRVSTAALACLAHTAPPDVARRLLIDFMRRPGADDRAQVHAAEHLIGLGAAEGIEEVRILLLREAGEGGLLSPQACVRCSLLLGLAGDARDIDLFYRLRAIVPEAIRALGWHGTTAAIPLLLEVLAESPADGRPSDAARTAAGALHRITGAGVRPDGALELDSERWSAWWIAHRAALRADGRYRFGRIHSPHVVLEELWNEGSAAGDRVLASLELGFHMGGIGSFEPTDWVARQRTALDRLAAFLVHEVAAPALP